MFCKRLRFRPFLSALLALFALSAFSLSASAHPFPPDVTAVQLKIHYHQIQCSLRCPASELLQPAGVRDVDLTGEDTKKPVIEKLEKWLPKQFALEFKGKPLTPEIVSADFQNAAQADSTSCALEIHYATDKPAEHLKATSHFVHTIISSGTSIEMHADRETVREFDTGANLGSVWNNLVDFVQMGMEHLFTGPDHILFICTLIFAVSNFRNVVKMLTGFTIGHSITLILSTFNVVHVNPRIADIGIALTIMYVGVENIFLKSAPKNRWMLVTAFGLVHGLSFSSSLREVGLPEQGLLLCLLGFNLGIEFAQIVIVACVYPALARLRWYQETLDSENGAKKYRRLMNWGSAATACMGLYWFVDRILHP